MKEINIKQAEKYAMLELHEEERIKILSDLSYILKMADEILEINTENVPETYSVSFANDIIRDDAEESFDEQIFNGCIPVPGLME